MEKAHHHGFVRPRHVLSPQLKLHAHVLHQQEAEADAVAGETKCATINHAPSRTRQTDGVIPLKTTTKEVLEQLPPTDVPFEQRREQCRSSAQHDLSVGGTLQDAERPLSERYSSGGDDYQLALRQQPFVP